MLKWREDYEVGIPEIDDQHRELLRLLAELQAAFAGESGWSAVHYRIVEIRQFAKFHFKFEEALMRMFGFEGLAKHRDTHTSILEEASRIELACLDWHANEEDITKFINSWIVGHIQTCDRAYATHILCGAKLQISETKPDRHATTE